ncbi:MAG: carboxypeptidase regulatory-like domain-containing protein [Candidatus Acidiferrales bacterium]
MRATGRLGVYLLVFVGLLGCAAAWGQTTGEIRGAVNDPSGAVVPGTIVNVTLTGTDTTRTVTSDKNGAFDIPELAVGSYDVSADAQGFKKFVAKNVIVSIGHVNFITVTLQLGAGNQTVTVEANAVQVETTSTQLGGVMTDQSIRELPLSTRNAFQLLQLQPGVQSQLGANLFYGSDNPGVVSVNGGRGRSNNYMVNGGDSNDIFVNSPGVQPSPDAIEEFRVITNTFDAEYGRNSGSVVNVVTKSGTNEIHGDFYEFIRNNVLNTAQPNPTGAEGINPDYKQNQFGATIGGPIKKDKTFIFGSYEGLRNVQGVTSSSGNVTLPTAAEVGGNFLECPQGGTTCANPAAPFGGFLTDQNFANVLQARPGCSAAIATAGGAPLNPGASWGAIFPNNVIPTQCFDPTAVALYNNYVAPYGTGQIFPIANNNERTDQFTIRLDHKITSTQQFSAYYYFNDDGLTNAYSNFQAAGATVPGFGALTATRNQQINLSHTWTLGSTAVNEFRFNYYREGQEKLNHPVNILSSVHDACGSAVPASNCFADPANPSGGITTDLPGHEGVPFIGVSGGFAIGNNSEGELPQAGNTFQWTDNYTKTTGRHTFKFGGEIRRSQFNQFLYYNINGLYSFANSGPDNEVSSDPGFPAYPNYFLGIPTTYSQGAAQGENDRNTSVALFVQDSFKLKPNLTLNYGLRWELNTPFYDTGNRLQTFRPGQDTTQYPCDLNPNNISSQVLIAAYGSTDCSPTGPANAVFPTGLVFPGDKGVPRGLTSTYYKAFAPRIGVAWAPSWTEGILGKIAGGPGKLSIRAGFGIFYNPIEQLVLEQFSAEPPFGGSAALSDTLFNLPFEYQSGGNAPNPFQGVINQTPKTPCAYDPSGPPGCVDWSSFRPALLFGEFQPHLKSQYSEQYNLTIERQITKDMIFRVGYVGTQSHHLLASHDLDYGNSDSCLEIAAIATANPNNVLSANGGSPTTCGTFSSDSSYYIAPGTVIPAYAPPQQPFPVKYTSCTGLVLPYNAGSGGTCLPANSVVGANGVTLVGLRPYSSPQCQPLSANGVGCPADGVPVFSNIFAEDTIANSNYNALQVSLEKSYSHGLLFQFSYTFSKAIDQGASFENELNPLNYNATRGVSLLDAKHRFVFSPVWDIPVPKYEGFKGKALNGWGASAIVTWQSGFPIRIFDPYDDELQSSYFFEDANTPVISGKPEFVNPKTNGGTYFLLNNISEPNPGTFGNMPHALCCGPALNNTDMVISKKTAINERWNTEFRAEFYNAWNHTQYANPDGNYGDSTFGQILNTREGPRVMQFALKFLF